jgi:hypothetical protein
MAFLMTLTLSSAAGHVPMIEKEKALSPVGLDEFVYARHGRELMG